MGRRLLLSLSLSLPLLLHAATPPTIHTESSADGHVVAVELLPPPDNAAAALFYTLDGSPPGASNPASSLYTGPFSLHTPGVITITATSGNATAVATVTVFAGTLSPPTIFPTEVFAVRGATAFDVHLAAGTPSGAALSFAVASTDDGRPNATAFQPYTAPFTLPLLGPVTVFAVASHEVYHPAEAAVDVFVVAQAFPLPQPTSPVCVAPSVSGDSSPAASFTPASPGFYRLQVSAYDGCQTYSDTVLVDVVCGQAPVAALLPPSATSAWDAASMTFQTLHLDASTSFLPDGDASDLLYQWVVSNWPPASAATSVSPSTSPATSFTPDVAGDYSVSVTVSSGCASAAAHAWVTASCPNALLADAGADRVVPAGASRPATSPFPPTTLTAGPALPFDEGVVYTWSLVAFPRGANVTAVPTGRMSAVLTPSVPGSYVLQLAVTDGCTTETATVTVDAVCEALPLLTVGERVQVGAASALLVARGDTSAGTPVEVTTGAAVVVGEPPADVVLEWSLVHVPTPTPGCVDDPSTLHDETLACSGSSLTAGAPLHNAASLTAAFFTPDSLGVYTLRLTQHGACSSRHDDVAVAVGCNTAPVAHAGGDRVFQRPGGSFPPVALNASLSSDAEDATLTYLWEFVGGPEGATLTAPHTPQAALHPVANGVYTVSLTVSDGCTSSTDTATIDVVCNSAPVAVTVSPTHATVYDGEGAGTGFAPVVLDATPSYDPDGAVDSLNYTWYLSRVDAVGGVIHEYDTPADAPVVTTPVLGNPARVLFAVPPSDITNTMATGGGPVSNQYEFRVTVSDGCSAATTSVSVSTTCPRSPLASASDGVVLEWNSQRGGRFSFPLDAASDVWACRAAGCEASIPVSGVSVYGLPGESAFWEVPPLPGLSVDDPASPNTTFTLALQYDNTAPFVEDGLGGTYAGELGPAWVVQDDCVTSSAVAASTLACNSAPTADAGSHQTHVYSPLQHFPTIALDGTASSPASVGADAGEADRDAPTFRFQWSLAHVPLDGGEDDVEEGLAGLDTPLPAMAPTAAHEAFVTSKVYDGNLGGVAGADGVCAAHAAGAGYPRPTEFGAMLCDGSGNDPAARLQVTGAVFATGAAMGGFSDAADIGRDFKVACGGECDTTLSSRALLSPITYDEFGDKVSSTVYAGCGRDGIVREDVSLCDNWTSASPTLAHFVGVTGAIGDNRFLSVASPCNQPHRLTCVRRVGATPSELGVHAGGLQSLQPSFTPNKLGTYVARLDVTDGCTAAFATVNVTIRCNSPPTAFGGPDQASTWSAGRFTPVTLAGSTPTDADGDDLFPSWRMVGFQPLPQPPAASPFAYEPSVVGNDSAALVNAHLLTPSLYPEKLGTFTVAMVASDGCSQGLDPVDVVVSCNAPPAVDDITLRSIWEGAAFSTVAMPSTVSDPDGERVELAWDPTPSHTPVNASQFAGGVVGEGAATLAGATSVQPTLTPPKLGTWTVSYDASDGCTIAKGSVVVLAECSLAPRLGVRATINGATTSWTDAEAGTPLRVTSPWHGDAGAFFDVSMSVAGASTFDPDGEDLVAAWEVVSFTPAADTVAPTPAELAAMLTVHVDSGMLAGGALLAPTALGTYVLSVSVSDGCNVVAASVLVVTGCDAPPDVTIEPLVATVVWSPAAHAFPASTFTVRAATGDSLAAVFASGIVWSAATHVPVPPSNTTSAALTGAADLLSVAPVPNTDRRVAVWQPAVLGTYTLRAAVSDGCAERSASATVGVGCGEAPVVDVGGGVLTSHWEGGSFADVVLPAQVLNPRSADLTGYTFQWVVVSGGGTLTNANELETTLTPADFGDSVVEVTVSDGCTTVGASLQVNARCNTAPSVSSLVKLDADGVGDTQGGASQWVGSGFQAVTVVGIVVDSDGDALDTLQWTVARPDGTVAQFPAEATTPQSATSTEARTNVTPASGGTHVITLTASDGCSTATASVAFHAGCQESPAVFVSPEVATSRWGSTGFAPTVLTATMDAGVGVDYNWTIVSVAAPAVLPAGVAPAVVSTTPLGTLQAADTASPVFHGAHLGLWTLALSASDGCQTATTTAVVVTECSTRPVVALAATTLTSSWDGTGFPSFSQVVLDAGPSADADGDVLGFEWEVVDVIPLAGGANIEPGRVGNDTGFTLSGLLSPTVALTPTTVGRWVFGVTVSDGCTSAQGSVQVVVACNEAPQAVAAGSHALFSQWDDGAFERVVLGTDGVVDPVESPGDGLQYAWNATFQPAVVTGVVAARLGGAPTVALPPTARPELVPAALGTWTVSVRVTDGCQWDTDTVVVEVACNTAPTVSAGDAVRVTTDGTSFPAIQLTGSAFDVDGDALNVEWVSAVHTPPPGYADLTPLGLPDAATLSDTGALDAVLQPTRLGDWVFTLRVDDGCSVVEALTTATVACPPPAGFPSIASPPPFTKYVSAGGVTTPEATISPAVPHVVLDFGGATPQWAFAEWEVVSHVCPNGTQPGLCEASRVGEASTQPQYTFSTTAVGEYGIQYRGFDGCNVLTGLVEVVVGCNPAPVAVAYAVMPDAPVHTNLVFKEVVLDGRASYDTPDPPGYDPQALVFAWEIVEAPPGSSRVGTEFLAHPSLDTSAFTPDAFGTYVVRLTVSDGCSSTAADTTVVIECNTAPVAFAGADFFTTAGQGNAVELAAGDAADVDADEAVYYQWETLSVPPGSTAQLEDASDRVASFVADVPGVFTFQVAAGNTPSPGLLAPGPRTCAATTDTVQVTVGCNTAPQAHLTSTTTGAVVWGRLAPADALPGFGGVTVWSNASTDADGDPLSTSWSLTAVPERSSLAGLRSVGGGTGVMFFPDTAGVYRVRAVVDDGCSSTPGVFTVTASCGAAPMAVIADPGHDFTLYDLIHATAVNDFTLDASQSAARFPGGVVGDAVLSYSWTVANAPHGSSVTSVMNAGTSAAVLQPDTPGAYVVNVTVSDGCTATTASFSANVVCSAPPVVTAPAYVEAVWASTASGTTVVDIPGEVVDQDDVLGIDSVRWGWEVVAAPVDSAVTGVAGGDGEGVAATLVADVTGQYSLRLTATDGCTSAAADVIVQVLCAAPDHNPVYIASEASGPTGVITAHQGEAVGVEAAFDYAAIADGALTSAGTVPHVEFTWVFVGDALAIDTGGTYPADLGSPLTLDRVRLLDGDGQEVDPASSAAADVDVVWALAVPVGSQASLTDNTALQPTFTPDVHGEYGLTVVMTSGCGRVTGHALAVAECRSAPTAVAGFYGTVVLTDAVVRDGVVLDASGSQGGLHYLWALDEVSTVQVFTADATNVSQAAVLQPPSPSTAWISSADQAVAALHPDGIGRHRVRVTVSDGCDNSSSVAEVVVVCGTPPVADAGPVQRFYSSPESSPLAATGGEVTLDGSSSTGALYSWQWQSVPPASALAATVGDVFSTAPSVAFSPDAAGTYMAQLSVSDGCSVAQDTAVVDVGHETPFLSVLGGPTSGLVGSPVAIDGVEYVNTLGEAVTDTTASTVPVSAVWAVVSAPAAATATISSPTLLQPTFTGDVAGVYTLEIRVMDAGNIRQATATVELRCASVAVPDVPAVQRMWFGEPATVAVGNAANYSGGGDALSWGFDAVLDTMVHKAATDTHLGVVLGAAGQGPAQPTGLRDADLQLGPGAAQVSFQPDGVGSYALRVTAAPSGCGGAATSADTVVVVQCRGGVAVDARVAPAGSVEVGTVLGLSGDTAGGATATAWVVEAAPPASSTAANPTVPFSESVEAQLRVDVAGVWALRLWASDGCTAVSSLVNVTVVTAANDTVGVGDDGSNNSSSPGVGVGDGMAGGDAVVVSGGGESSKYKAAFGVVLGIAVVQLALLVVGVVLLLKSRQTIETVKQAKAMPSFFPSEAGVPRGGVAFMAPSGGTETASVGSDGNPISPTDVRENPLVGAGVGGGMTAGAGAASGEVGAALPMVPEAGEAEPGSVEEGVEEGVEDGVNEGAAASGDGEGRVDAVEPMVLPGGTTAARQPASRASIRMMDAGAAKPPPPPPTNMLSPGYVVSPTHRQAARLPDLPQPAAPSPKKTRRRQRKPPVDAPAAPSPRSLIVSPEGDVVAPRGVILKPGGKPGSEPEEASTVPRLPSLNDIIKAQPPPPPAVRGRRRSFRSMGSSGTPRAGDGATPRATDGNPGEDDIVVANGVDAVEALMNSWTASP